MKLINSQRTVNTYLGICNHDSIVGWQCQQCFKFISRADIENGIKIELTHKELEAAWVVLGVVVNQKSVFSKYFGEGRTDVRIHMYGDVRKGVSASDNNHLEALIMATADYITAYDPDGGFHGSK